MNKMLGDLAEVVRKMDAIKAAGWNADDREVIDTRVKCVDFIRKHHATITDMANRVEMMEEALFQISVRLDAPREHDMDEGSWHADMIARAQYLANQEKRLWAAERDTARLKALGQDLDELKNRAWVNPKMVIDILRCAAELLREQTEGVG